VPDTSTTRRTVMPTPYAGRRAVIRSAVRAVPGRSGWQRPAASPGSASRRRDASA